MPTHERLSALDRTCGPLWHTALAAEQENLVLEQLRDLLLPKLMSGAVRVRDIKLVVREAV
ncbi:MAG: hypothetical protein M3083_23185 [Actinomycetota bacterium]|nr:hypothetical protein [Actinomycetota bacterium]